MSGKTTGPQLGGSAGPRDRVLKEYDVDLRTLRLAIRVVDAIDRRAHAENSGAFGRRHLTDVKLELERMAKRQRSLNSRRRRTGGGA